MDELDNDGPDIRVENTGLQFSVLQFPVIFLPSVSTCRSVIGPFTFFFSVVYGWKCIFHFVVCSVVSGPLLPPTEVFLVLRLLIPVLYGVKETQDWKTTDPEARLIFQPAGRGAMENEGLEDDGLTSRVAVGLARCVSLILR